MKKYKILLAVFSATMLVSALSACSGALHTHTWALKERVNATCEQSGGSIYQCECGENYVREIAALGHDWKETDNGSYTCERCGKQKTDDDTEIPADSSSSSAEIPADSSSSNVEIPADSSSSNVEIPADSSSSSADVPVDSSSSSAEIPVDSSSNSADVPVDSSSSSAEIPVDSSSSNVEIPADSSSSNAEIPVDSSSSNVEIPADSSSSDMLDSLDSSESSDSSDVVDSSDSSSDSSADNPAQSNPVFVPLELEKGELTYELNKKGEYVCTGAENKSSMQELIIPPTYEGKPVTEIAEEAFMDCKRLLCVHLGKNLTKIGNNAFQACSNITEVHNYYNLSLEPSWDDEMNYWDSGILNSNPDVYETLTEHAFVCDSNGFITCETNGVRKLVGYVGESTDLVLPAYIVEVNIDVFGTCEGLRSVTLSDSILKVTRYTFRGCTSLESVTFGKGLEEIEANAFRDCTSLKEAIFTENRVWATFKKDDKEEKEKETERFEWKNLQQSADMAKKLLELKDQRWSVVNE